IVPTRSHIPTTTSRLVDVIGEIPKSPHNVTKCGVSPRLDTPQIAKVKARTQNSVVREAVAKAMKLTANTLPEGGGGGVCKLKSQNGASPRSDGRSRANKTKANASSAIITIEGTSAARQP